MNSANVRLAARNLALMGLVAAFSSAGCATAPAPQPVPGGRIFTLPLGTYTCELPGDPGGPAGKAQADYEFRVVNASAYKSGGIRGSYLFTGTTVVMTGGKLKGLTLHKISNGFLRQVRKDGTDGDLRCVLTSHR